MGRGSVVVPGDFLDLGSRQAIDLALYRLAKKGVLRSTHRTPLNSQCTAREGLHQLTVVLANHTEAGAIRRARRLPTSGPVCVETMPAPELKHGHSLNLKEARLL